MAGQVSVEQALDSREVGGSRKRSARTAALLIPYIIGLACSRVAVLGVHAVGDVQAGGNVLDDDMGIWKCAVLAIVMVALFFRKKGPERSNPLAAYALWGLQAACLVLLMASRAVGFAGQEALFATSVLGSVAGTMATMFWFVKARGFGPGHLLVFVFASCGVSEVLALSIAFGEALHACGAGLASLAVQAACLRWIDGRLGGEGGRKPLGEGGYFSGLESKFGEQRFAVACVACCALLSVANGLLQGYPDGSSSDMTDGARVLSCGLVGLLCLAATALALRRSPLVIVVATWIVMQVLGAVSVAAYAVSPDDLAFGEVFAVVLESIKGAFKWYVTIALLSMGRKNPYYYAILIHLVFLLPRDFARWALGFASDAFAIDPAVVLACSAFILIVAGQILLYEVILVLVAKGRVKEKQSGLLYETILGLDPDVSLQEMRQQAMRTNVEIMGRRYSLSEREVDVLTLIALGHTQKRAAEELFISTNTLHTHMRHVYEKTGLHSRQEVLDYIGSMDDEPCSRRES